MAPVDTTLAHAQALFVQRQRSANRSPNSLKAHLADFAALTPHIVRQVGAPADALELRQITGEVLLAAYDAWAHSRTPTKAQVRSGARASEGQPYALKTQARVRSTWAGMFDLMIELDYLEKNPTRALGEIHVPRSDPKPLAGWEADTIARLFTYVGSAAWETANRIAWPERDRSILCWFLGTGLRSSEALALRVGSIEGLPGQRFTRVLGKGSKWRSVPVPATIEDAHEAYVESRRRRFPAWRPQPNDPLFVSLVRDPEAAADDRNGGKILTQRQLDYLVERMLVGAGLGASKPDGALVHALRHTFGTLMNAAGVNVVDLADLMGHESIETTKGYTRASEVGKRRAMESNPALAAMG